MYKVWRAVCLLLVISAVGILFPLTNFVSYANSVAPYSPQLGIDIAVYPKIATQSDATAVSELDALCAYVVSLHANAISYNIPFDDPSLTSNDPQDSPGTPSPSRLETMIRIARSYGLSVQVRPLLDQSKFPPPGWRGDIAPTDPSEFFANYQSMLSPLLEASRIAGANSFVIGAELNSLLNDLPEWTELVSFAQKIFGPSISYSASRFAIETIPGISLGLDFYTPISAKYVPNPSEATVANLQAGMQANLDLVPVPLRNVGLQEIFAAAVASSYESPAATNYPLGTALDRTAQVNWFTAACNVMWANHMSGIFYWQLNLPGYAAGENDSSNYYLWAGTAAATAIQKCFERS